MNEGNRFAIGLILMVIGAGAIQLGHNLNERDQHARIERQLQKIDHEIDGLRMEIEQLPGWNHAQQTTFWCKQDVTVTCHGENTSQVSQRFSPESETSVLTVDGTTTSVTEPHGPLHVQTPPVNTALRTDSPTFNTTGTPIPPGYITAIHK